MFPSTNLASPGFLAFSTNLYASLCISPSLDQSLFSFLPFPFSLLSLFGLGAPLRAISINTSSSFSSSSSNFLISSSSPCSSSSSFIHLQISSWHLESSFKLGESVKLENPFQNSFFLSPRLLSICLFVCLFISIVCRSLWPT